MRIAPDLDIDDAALAAVCDRYGIAELKVFGSRARGTAGPISDIDVLYSLLPGRKLGWIVRPLEAVGCYVPSGRYPLPSTLLMTAIFAQTAGVPRICVASPKPSIEILGCAHLLGITEFYRVGGAQAIAAMALGTATIRKTQKIFGPGNSYVVAAKRLLVGHVVIDLLPGPSELLVLADDSAEPAFIAADCIRDESGCVLRYERSFMRPFLGADK